jgi:hypothetical protein
MNTKSKNLNDHEKFDNALARMVNPENYIDFPLTVPKLVKLNRKDGSKLTMKPRLLGDWLATVDESNGVYFMEFDSANLDNYELYYSGPANERPLEMKMVHSVNENENPKKEFLERLIFDLTLFEGDEPIVVWEKSLFVDALKQLSEKYYEYADEVDSILERLVDMEQVFKEQWHWDSRFNGNTVKSVHSALYPSHNGKIKAISIAMYDIYQAIENIYFQIDEQLVRMNMAA